jgi:hypothetical protein
LFSRYQDLVQEYAQHEQTTKASAPVKRLSARDADVSKRLAEYWHVPADNPQAMAEMNLFPKRMIL